MYEKLWQQGLDNRQKSRTANIVDRAATARGEKKPWERSSSPATDIQHNKARSKDKNNSDVAESVACREPRESEPKAEVAVTNGGASAQIAKQEDPVKIVQPTRISTRLRKNTSSSQTAIADEPPIVKYSKANHIPKWDAPLVYPFSGTNRTTVNFEDLERLDDGELLNDNLINFCLIHSMSQHPDLAKKVHIFNTYFFSSLTTTKSGTRTGFNYDAVKRWTKNIDLFGLPYVIVPVNVDLHWYVSIVVNLDEFSKPTTDTESTQGTEKDNKSVVRDAPAVLDPEAPPPLPDRGTPSQQFERMSLDEERQETSPVPESSAAEAGYEIPDSDDERRKQQEYEAALANDVDEPPSSSVPKSANKGKKKVPPLRKFDPNQPLIITLDSLGGVHTQQVRFLKEYVVAEALDKRAMSIDVKDIRGMTAKGIPEQTNFCDCGVYLVGYVNEFLKDPRRFVEKVCSKELDQNNDFRDFDPAKKRAEIRTTLMELAELHKAESAKIKQEKRAAKRAGK